MNNETPKKLPLLGIPYICRFLKPHRKVIAVIIIFMGLGSLIESCFPLFQIYAINNFALGQNLGNIPYFIAAYIGLLLIQGVINGIGSYASCAAEVYVDRDIKQICFEHVQRLSLTYFNRHGVGYIHSRVIADADKIGIIVSWNLMDIVIDVCYLFGISIIMLRLNFTLGIILIMAVPVEILITALFTGLMADENRKVREHNSRITGSFNEGVTGAETIKTLAIENKMIDGFKTETLAMKLAAIRAGRFKAFFNSSIIFCSGLALSIVLWRGGIIASEGVMLIGTLSVFMNYALSITAYIQALVGTVSNLIGTAVNIERVADLLATEPEIIESDEALRRYGDIFDDANADAGNADAAGAGGASDPGLDIAAFDNEKVTGDIEKITGDIEKITGDIELRDVTFKYPDGEVNVLEHFSLKIPHGTTTAIVGETGAGKSTLVNLICRFYEPTDGSIFLDGRDIRERTQYWLHRHIGYVLQSPQLFDDTVRENLRFGAPEATDEEIMEALRRVNAVNVIDRLDGGLDAGVGEGGNLLSVGEKQLISFARALLSDPDILVLDEATSSIDTITEKKLQSAISELTKGRTCFIIAHRLSTIRHADKIIVMRDGCIVETGTHKELIKKHGYYEELYKQQSTEAVLELPD